MFIVGCQDQSTAVSVAAMAATANYINAISDEPEVMQLQCVLTPMLGVMHACLQRGTEPFYDNLRNEQSFNSALTYHVHTIIFNRR